MPIKVVGDILRASAAVTALVPAARITPLVRPQSIAVPAITITSISTIPQNTLRGDGSLDYNRVQVDAWAETYVAARAVADAVRAALSEQGIQMLDERPNFDPAVATDIYQVSQDYQVWV